MTVLLVYPDFLMTKTHTKENIPLDKESPESTEVVRSIGFISYHP